MAAEGCEPYAIHDPPDGSIVMLETWTSAALLDAHGQGEPVSQLNAAFSDWRPSAWCPGIGPHGA